MRKVLVNKDGLVVNAIEIEEGADYTPPEGHTLFSEKISEVADIGDFLKDNVLTKPAFVDRTGKTVKPKPISIIGMTEEI